jgi:hypothetical protein
VSKREDGVWDQPDRAKGFHARVGCSVSNELQRKLRVLKDWQHTGVHLTERDEQLEKFDAKC